MNYDRIFEYKFKAVDRANKKVIWMEIVNFIYKKLGNPESMMDPAAGQYEFVNVVPSKEKRAINMNLVLSAFANSKYTYRHFRQKEIHPQFLPLSLFRGKLPVNRFLARVYFSLRLSWRFYSKQLPIIEQKG
jgi:hypothetical protein